MSISKAHPVAAYQLLFDPSFYLRQSVLHSVVSSLKQAGEHGEECNVNNAKPLNKRWNYKLTVLKLQTSAI